MEWIDINPDDDNTFPPEGYTVVANDGSLIRNALLYYLRSGEYVWMQTDEEKDCSDEFTAFVPTRWYMLPQDLEKDMEVICIRDDENSGAIRGESYTLINLCYIEIPFSEKHPVVLYSDGNKMAASWMCNFVSRAESRSQTIEEIIK